MNSPCQEFWTQKIRIHRDDVLKPVLRGQTRPNVEARRDLAMVDGVEEVTVVHQDSRCPTQLQSRDQANDVQQKRLDTADALTRVARNVWTDGQQTLCRNDEYGYGLEAAEGAKLAGHTIEVFHQKYVQAPPDFTTKTARHMSGVPGPTVKSLTRVRAV